jgi:transposase InsO family protein
MRGYAGRRIRVSENCDCCQESKAQKRRSTSEVPREASEIGANWHVDLLGKQAVSGLETGNKYFIIFIDRFSRYRLGFGLKSNNVESILLAVNRWYKKAVLKAKALGTANLKISLYSDNLEMKYPDIQEWCATNGIEQFFTAPGHSSSNGLVERAIGVTRNMARALLKARDLPEEFWELAMRHACFLTNRLPFDYRGSFQPDPFSAWTGHTFDYSKIRIFGSKCYVLRTDNKKDFSSKAKIGIYVGHMQRILTHF